MSKKYQVFVSSTYEDLGPERQKVIEAVLNCECIPVGMEYFPAGDDSQWEFIKRFIKQCDYYIVIVAGRYGSTDKEGKSYTQKEYEFAIDSKIPVMAFLHGDVDNIPKNKLDISPDMMSKLESFRKLCKQKMCKEWTTPDGLAAQVAFSLNAVKLSNPQIGWIRANEVPVDASQRLFQMTMKIEQLEKQLQDVKTLPPPGTENLSQGDDVISVTYSYKYRIEYDSSAGGIAQLTWNQIFAFIAPNMMSPKNEYEIKRFIGNLISSVELVAILKNFPKAEFFRDFDCSDDDFNTIKIQFRSLGLIERDAEAIECWRLTPYGDQVMVQLRAIKRIKSNSTKPESLKQD